MKRDRFSAPARARGASPQRRDKVGGRLIFQRAAQRMLDGRLANTLLGASRKLWYAGTLSPSGYKRRLDDLESQVRVLTNFCAEALLRGVIRPLNSPPRRIRDEEDWSEALEVLEGLRLMLLANAETRPPAMTARDVRELGYFCGARSGGGGGAGSFAPNRFGLAAPPGAPSCEAPCGQQRRTLGKILFGKKSARRLCVVAVGPAAKDARALEAARRGRAARMQREAHRAADLTPPSSRGTPYRIAMPSDPPLEEVRFDAIQKAARAAGVSLFKAKHRSPSKRAQSAAKEARKAQSAAKAAGKAQSAAKAAGKAQSATKPKKIGNKLSPKRGSIPAKRPSRAAPKRPLRRSQ